MRMTHQRVIERVGHTFFLEQNRRVSNALSPIFYLFLIPSGILYQKVQRLLAEDELTGQSHPPLLKHRRPGPKHPANSITTSEWPNVVQRVIEHHESLRQVASAYGVSHETIRRILRTFRNHRAG